MGNPGIIAGATLLGGVLLWEVTLRSQMGMSISFLEEMWSRNLGHVFVSPLRPFEMVAALIGMSIIRMLLGVVPAILLAWGFYAFNLFTLGAGAGPVLHQPDDHGLGGGAGRRLADLAARRRGGTAGLGTAVRVGAVLGRILPGVGAAGVRPAASPTRCRRPMCSRACAAALLQGVIRWDHLAAAFALNLVWLAGAALLFTRQFHAARVSGALISIGE